MRRRIQSPRTDVAPPLTWEVPAAITSAGVLMAALVLPSAQGLAGALAGHGFVWPRHALARNIAGLLDGRPGEGLAASQTALPPAWLVYGMVGVLETVVLALVIASVVLWWRSVGPGAQFGLAKRHEVAAVLGPQALFSRRRTIRPDLGAARTRLSWRWWR